MLDNSSRHPGEFYNVENLAIDRIFRVPNGSVPASFFKNLRRRNLGMALVDCDTTSLASRIRMFARLSRPEDIELILNSAVASEGRLANPRNEEWVRNTVFFRTKAEFQALYQTRSLDSFPIAGAQYQQNITIELSVDHWEEDTSTLSRKLVVVGASPHRTDRLTERARAMLLLSIASST